MIINQEKVAAALRECADYIKERAKDIVGDDFDRTTRIEVKIEFSFPIEAPPTITVEREYAAFEAARVLVYGAEQA